MYASCDAIKFLIQWSKLKSVGNPRNSRDFTNMHAPTTSTSRVVVGDCVDVDFASFQRWKMSGSDGEAWKFIVTGYRSCEVRVPQVLQSVKTIVVEMRRGEEQLLTVRPANAKGRTVQTVEIYVCLRHGESVRTR